MTSRFAQLRDASFIQLPRPIGFVLGGGASLGAVQVGMLRALAEGEIAPDHITATSVGALNGAMLAASAGGDLDPIVSMWSGLTRNDVFPGNLLDMLWRLGRSRTHAIEHAALQTMIERTLEVDQFDQLLIPLRVVALELLTGHEVILDSGALVPALLATTAIPGIFPAVEIDGRSLVDGGVVANVPVRHGLAAGAASLVVLDTTVPALAVDRSTPEPSEVSDVLARVTQIQYRAQLLASLPKVAQQVPVVYLPPPAPRVVSPLEFAQSTALIHDAYVAAKYFLQRLVVDGPGIYGAPYARYVGHPNAPLETQTHRVIEVNEAPAAH